MEVEKRCNELAIQLEKAREEGEKKILEREVEILLLRREEGLKKRWEVEFEENLNWATTRSPLHVGVDERENLGSVENSHLDQSLLSELGSTWNGGVQLEQSLREGCKKKRPFFIVFYYEGVRTPPLHSHVG